MANTLTLKTIRKPVATKTAIHISNMYLHNVCKLINIGPKNTMNHYFVNLAIISAFATCLSVPASTR